MAATGPHLSAVRGPVHLVAGTTWTGLPSNTFVHGRVARTVIVDRGALVVSPPPVVVHTAINRLKAQSEVEATTTAAPGVVDPAGTALGLVRILPTVHATVQIPRPQLAWVAVVGPQLAATCPPVQRVGDRYKPSFHVVVIAATGTSAVSYRSRGTGACGSPIHPPSIGTSTEIVSFPWQGLGSTQVSTSPPRYLWRIGYRLPRCGSLFDSPGIFQPDMPTLFLQATVPLVPTRACPTQMEQTTVFGPEKVPIDQVMHAPLGVHQF
jgi:hypothetical protein